MIPRSQPVTAAEVTRALDEHKTWLHASELAKRIYITRHPGTQRHYAPPLERPQTPPPATLLRPSNLKKILAAMVADGRLARLAPHTPENNTHCEAWDLSERVRAAQARERAAEAHRQTAAQAATRMYEVLGALVDARVTSSGGDVVIRLTAHDADRLVSQLAECTTGIGLSGRTA